MARLNDTQALRGPLGPVGSTLSYPERGEDKFRPSEFEKEMREFERMPAYSPNRGAACRYREGGPTKSLASNRNAQSATAYLNGGVDSRAGGSRSEWNRDYEGAKRPGR